MLGSFLAIFTGLSWGFGIFFSGKASRKMSPFLLTALYNSFAFIFFSIVVLFTSEIKVVSEYGSNSLILKTVGSAAISGLGFGMGILLVSKGLSKGRAGVVGPLVALVSVTVPVLYTAIFESLPNAIAVTGILILLCVPWLISKGTAALPHVNTTVTRDAFYGAGAGASFGFYLIGLLIVPDKTQILMLTIAQFVSAVFMISLHLIQKGSWSIPKEIRKYAAIFISFELLGNILLRYCLNIGTTASVATISAIAHPAGLLILSRVIAKEKFSRYQLVGFALVALGIALVVPNS